VLQAIAERWAARVVRVTAPVSLRGFYEQFGFRKTEGPFLEHGVPFIGLTCQLRGARTAFGNWRRERNAAPVASTFELL
jgi:ElaA protein